MSSNFSTTQATNFASIAGAIVVIVKLFDPSIEIEVGEVAIFLGACAVVVSSVISFVSRFKKGDVNIVGVRKYRR